MSGAQWFLTLAGLYGAAGVALGAFGAHGLKTQLGSSLETWQTAVLYHLVHALALLVVGLWLRLVPGAGGSVVVAGVAFAVGVLLFSGSLYALALGGPRWFGPITPLGGVSFVLGWLALSFAALRPTA